MSKYGDELQNFETARNISRNHKNTNSRQRNASGGAKENSHALGTSVIRRKSFDRTNGGTLRYAANGDDLSDIFGGMTVQEKSHLNTDLSTVHEVDAKRGGQRMDDSTVKDGYDQVYDSQNIDGDDDKVQYATLTQSNVNKLEDTRNLSKDQRTLKKNDFLRRYAESQYEDYDDIYDETGDGFDSQIQQAIDMKAEEDPELSKQSQDIESHLQHNGIRNPFLSVPVSKYTIKASKRRTPRSESNDSFSSLSTSKSVPTATSSTSFTESDSEQSDYSNDFADDELDFSKAALVKKLQQRQKMAEERAATVNRERKMRYRQMRDSFNKRDYFEDNQKPLSDDFENLDEFNSSKLKRFRIVNRMGLNTDTLDRKRSMPVLIKSNDKPFQSGKTIRKYSSTLDLPSRYPVYSKSKGARYPPVSLSLKSRPYYNNKELVDDDNEDGENSNDGDDIYSFADPVPDDSVDELTITLADYEKLKRKSHRIDLTKYQESPTRRRLVHRVPDEQLPNGNDKSKHNHFHRHHGHQHRYKAEPAENYKGLTNTARLSKEGKLKIIRSLGKHKTKQVLPGHLYGEIVYDPDQMKWCGNDEDLLPFEPVSKPSLIKHYSTLRQHQSQEQFAQAKLQEHASTPSISKQEVQMTPGPMVNDNANKVDDNDGFPQIVGSMVYDNKNLRWVSLTGQYEDDPFENMDDTVASENINNQVSAVPQARHRRSSRTSMRLGAIPRNSVSKTRVPSSVSCSSIPNYAKQIESENPLKIKVESYKMWKAEESRWMRKVRNWFPSQDDDLNFCYELKSFLDEQ